MYILWNLTEECERSESAVEYKIVEFTNISGNNHQTSTHKTMLESYCR